MASNPPKFTELNDLTCEEIGGKILFATDDWFACKLQCQKLTANIKLYQRHQHNLDLTIHKLFH
jgi:allantoicase